MCTLIYYLFRSLFYDTVKNAKIIMSDFESGNQLLTIKILEYALGALMKIRKKKFLF
jgi:hypothetical protein